MRRSRSANEGEEHEEGKLRGGGVQMRRRRSAHEEEEECK